MLETCEYFGHPVLMHDNLGDFMMEIVSDHGMEIVKKMTRQNDLNLEKETIRRKTSEIEKSFEFDRLVAIQLLIMN